MPDFGLPYTYKEHSITLTSEYVFAVEGPHFDTADGQRYHYASMREARSTIDNAIEAHAKQQKASHVVSLVLLKEDGEPVTIRGIHMNTGDLLGLKKVGYYTPSVYPDVQWIKDLLQETHKLSLRGKEIEAAINAYRINGNYGYGRIALENYDRLLQRFLSEHNEKLTRAIRLPEAKEE